MINNKKYQAEKPHKKSVELRRMAPVLCLLLLAPVSAEILVGYLSFTGDLPAMLASLIFFTPLYGGAALIIREITRRSGRGWPTMLLLASAFGVFQAGLVDKSLFNLEFGGIEWWQEFASATYIPALGISGYMALSFVAGHVIWSIGAPIAVTEALAGRRSKTPWLGRRGLAVAIVFYILAPLVIFAFADEGKFFLPSWPQLAGAAIVVAAFLVAAFFVERSPKPATKQKMTPASWKVGAAAFALLSVETVVDIITRIFNLDASLLIDWPGFALHAAVLASLGILVWFWSRRTSWGSAHILAVGAAALFARATAAFLVEPIDGDAALQGKLLSNALLFIPILALTIIAGRVVRRDRAQVHRT